MNRLIDLILIGVLLLTTTACGGWETKEDWNLGIWSDDEESVLAFKSIYERRREIGASNYKTRNYEIQVYKADASNLNARSEIGPRMAGTVDSAWYMHSEGYFIIGHAQSVSDEYTNGSYRYQNRPLAFQKVTLDGASTTVASTTSIYMKGCGAPGSMTAVMSPLQVIPSPDGTILAVVETAEDCESVTGTITFKNASDLTNIGPSYPLSLELRQNSFAFLDLGNAWLDSGEFFIGQGSGFGVFTFSGFKYAPNQEPVAASGIEQDCLMPKTTSGLNWKGSLNVNESGISEGAPYDFQFGCPQ